MTQRFPASDQNGEAPFALPAQTTEQPVHRAVRDREAVAVGRLLDRGFDAVTCTVIAGVS